MTRRFQFSLRTLLLVVTVAAAVIAAGMYGYRQSKIDNQRYANSLRMRHTLRSLHFSEELTNSNRLPPPTLLDSTGQPLSSWRFFTLTPYCGIFGIDQPFEPEKPWTSPANTMWRNWSYPELCFPQPPRTAANAYDTNVFAITGSGTAFDPPNRISVKQLAEDVATRDVILVAEIRNSKTHWMQPGDFDIRTMPHTIDDAAGEGISGTCPGGFFVGFADQEVWMLRNDTPFDKLAMFFTLDGARQHDRDTVLGPYRVAVPSGR